HHRRAGADPRSQGALRPVASATSPACSSAAARGRGIASASSVATNAAPAAITSAVRNPASDGTSWPATCIVIAASTAPITALEIDVPSDRASAFNPLAAAVSDTGTAALISAGSDENANPTPTLTTTLNRHSCHGRSISHSPARYPAATISDPATSVKRGPRAPAISAASGDASIIASPPGAIHSPVCSSDCPSP